MSEFARDELRRATNSRPSALTIGNFDGVHRGHQYLFRHLVKRARELNLAAGAVTLYPDPARVLRPQEPFQYLTSLEERLELLRETGLNVLAPITFTSELAELAPEEFVTMLREELNMRLLLMGPDNLIGRGREGTPERLAKLGASLGFEVETLPAPLRDSDRPISASAIRAALAEGDLAQVEEQLGRRYSIRGPVVEGFQRGRDLGFPTANIAITADRALPAFGVYATWAVLGENRYPSATNIGRRPQFAGDNTTVETFIFDFAEDIYGRILKIELVARLRPEAKFASLEELKARMDQDVVEAREILRR